MSKRDQLIKIFVAQLILTFDNSEMVYDAATDCADALLERPELFGCTCCNCICVKCKNCGNDDE